MAFRKLKAFSGTLRRKLKALRRDKPRPTSQVDDSETGPDPAEEIRALKGWMDSLDEPRDDKSDNGEGQDNSDGGAEAKANVNGPYDSRLPRATSVPDFWRRGKAETALAANTVETKQSTNITTGRVVSEGSSNQQVPRGNGAESPSVSPSVAARKDAIVRHLDTGRRVPNSKEISISQSSLRSNNSTRKVTASTLPGLPEEDSAASPDTQSVVDEAVGEDTQGTVRKFPKPSTLPKKTSALVATMAAGINRVEDMRSASDRRVSQDSLGRTTHVTTPGFLSNDPDSVKRTPPASKSNPILSKNVGAANRSAASKSAAPLKNIPQTDGTADFEDDKTTEPRPRGGAPQRCGPSNGDLSVADFPPTGHSSEADLCPRDSLATIRGSEASSGASEVSHLFTAPENLSEDPAIALRQIGESVWKQVEAQNPDLCRAITPLQDYELDVFECMHRVMLAKANKADKKRVAQRPVKRPALRDALGSLKRRIQETKERLRAKERHHCRPDPLSSDTSLHQQSKAQAASNHKATSPSSYRAVESIINDYATEKPSSQVNIDLKLSGDAKRRDSLDSTAKPSWADDATAAILRKSLDITEPPPGSECIIVGGLPPPHSSNVRLHLLNNKDLFVQKPMNLGSAPGTEKVQRKSLSSEYSMTHDKPFGDIPDVKGLLSERQMDSVFRNASENAAHFASARSRASSHRSTKERLHDFMSGIRHVSWSEARGRRHLKRSPLPTSMIEG